MPSDRTNGLSDTTRALLMQCAVSTLTTALLKRGLRNQYLTGVQPIAAGAPNMVGPAYTMRFVPAREDIDTLAALRADGNVQRIAIEQCPAGAVLIVDAQSDRRSATAGDLVAGRLKVRGCAGIVTDGGFRDLGGIARLGFPAYQRWNAAGASPIGIHAADVQVPIGCAGVAVYPGDIVVGDAEGVVILPAHLADELAQEAAEATAYDAFAELRIAEGAAFGDIFPPSDASRAAFAAWRAQASDVQ